MFNQDKEKRLADNELFMDSLNEILDEQYTTILSKEGNKVIINVYSNLEDRNFSISKDKNGIHVVKLNGKEVNVTIACNDNQLYVSNKDLNLEYGYKFENLKDEIHRITTYQKVDDSTFCQSYVEKNSEAIMIYSEEEIPIDKIELNPNDKLDFKKLSVVIKNNNLLNVSEEEMYKYLKKEELGSGKIEEYCEIKKEEYDEDFDEENQEEYDESDVEDEEYDDEFDIEDENEYDDEFDIDEDEEYDDEFCIEDENEYDEEFDQNDLEEEDQNSKKYEEYYPKMTKKEEKKLLEEYNKRYSNYKIFENFIEQSDEKTVDLYEMLEDFNIELQDNIFIDRECMLNTENSYKKLLGIYKSIWKTKMDNDINR